LLDHLFKPASPAQLPKPERSKFKRATDADALDIFDKEVIDSFGKVDEALRGRLPIEAIQNPLVSQTGDICGRGYPGYGPHIFGATGAALCRLVAAETAIELFPDAQERDLAVGAYFLIVALFSLTQSTAVA
jgi:hypothetical protein